MSDLARLRRELRRIESFSEQEAREYADWLRVEYLKTYEVLRQSPEFQAACLEPPRPSLAVDEEPEHVCSLVVELALGDEYEG